MDAHASIGHVILERLLERAAPGGARLTQDSPILPDVWVAYGLHGSQVEGRALDLLLTSHWQSNAIALAEGLRARLHGGPARADGVDRASAAAIACTQGTVAARLGFDELLWAALPLTRWWHHYLIVPAGEPLALWRDPETGPGLRAELLAGLKRLRRAPDGPRALAEGRRPRRVAEDLVWLVEVAGTLKRLLTAHPGGLLSLETGSEAALEDALARARGAAEDVLTAFLSIFDGAPPAAAAQETLWSVNRNRRGGLAMFRSTATVKADAARQVFGVRGAKIRWAVVDSGIDATHPAFRRRDGSGRPVADWTRGTRVLATFDFSRAREQLAEGLGGIAGAQRSAGLAVQETSVSPAMLRGIDWARWEERLRVPHDALGYRPPVHGHGTHVAGILAADWRPEDSADDDLQASPLASPRERARTGVCPEIELYDIRVTDDDGICDEFAVLAALQFLRAFNARHEHLEIMGANLSISLFHKVANYACGRTPVCEECERLVASGVVVVAAAGNDGRARYLTARGELDDGYRSISITDPGNAPSVITVGATHRSDPHTYGVSFFSSRGPTGDGRQKPDLVAPGEKVVSTLPDGREDAMDGTSMAAPHVSGAAALLLERHPEFIGRPAEIKRILCATAVDLGRERHFQGAGLLDILQALESI